MVIHERNLARRRAPWPMVASTCGWSFAYRWMDRAQAPACAVLHKIRRKRWEPGVGLFGQLRGGYFPGQQRHCRSRVHRRRTKFAGHSRRRKEPANSRNNTEKRDHRDFAARQVTPARGAGKAQVIAAIV